MLQEKESSLVERISDAFGSPAMPSEFANCGDSPLYITRTVVEDANERLCIEKRTCWYCGASVTWEVRVRSGRIIDMDIGKLWHLNGCPRWPLLEECWE